MKALQYAQVLLLIAGIAYLAAFHFANRAGLSFPVPFGSNLAAPASLALLGGFLGGLAYAALVFLPPAFRAAGRARRLERRVRDLEARLAAASLPRETAVIPDRDPAAPPETARLQPDGAPS